MRFLRSGLAPLRTQNCKYSRRQADINPGMRREKSFGSQTMTGRRATGRTIFTTLILGALAAPLGGCNGVFPGGTGDGGTQFSEAGCGSSYTDPAFDYGFELPAEAEMIRTKNESNSLTNSVWTFTDGEALINVITRVQAASADADLGTVVSFTNDLSVSAGADLLGEEEVILANGSTAILTTIRFDGLTTFRVETLSNSRMYTVEAVVEESARTADLDDLLSDIVLSLCVGE
jgi:hypothetical protein